MFDGHLMALVHDSVGSSHPAVGAALQSYEVVSARAARVVSSGQDVVHRVARCVSLVGELGRGPNGTEGTVHQPVDDSVSAGSLVASVLDFDSYDELDALAAGSGRGLRACGSQVWARDYAKREVVLRQCLYNLQGMVKSKEKERVVKLVHCWAASCTENLCSDPRRSVGPSIFSIFEYGGSAGGAGLLFGGARQSIANWLDKKLRGELCTNLSEFDTASIQNDISPPEKLDGSIVSLILLGVIIVVCPPDYILWWCLLGGGAILFLNSWCSSVVYEASCKASGPVEGYTMVASSWEASSQGSTAFDWKTGLQFAAPAKQGLSG